MTRFRNATLALVLLAAPSHAHDTWLMPAQFAYDAGANAELDLTSGAAFPELDAAIEPKRVARAAYRLAGQTTDITSNAPAEHSLRFATALPAAGIATIWVELTPNAIQLTPEQVEEYLAEIGARDTVRQRWLASSTKRWSELYTKHAKTFVRVGAPQADRSWSQRVGMFLEIVPDVDPTTLVAGDELRVSVLREGASLSGLTLGLVREGAEGEQQQRTDGGGQATFRLDAPGRWLVHGTYLRAAPGPDLDWESHFTTLTLDVAASPAP